MIEMASCSGVNYSSLASDPLPARTATVSTSSSSVTESSGTPVYPTPGATLAISSSPAMTFTPAGGKAAVEASSVPQETATLSAILPVEHHIINITGHRQYFSLGCEAAAAKDWANYFGKDFNEFEFQYRLPISDNPDYGFVGDVNGPWGQVPPYAYGVYAGPIAALLNDYGIQAKAYKGYTLDQLKAKIADDIPVITWVIGNVVLGVPVNYTDSEGRKTVVAAYEHVVIVTGYSEDSIRYMNNGRFYDIPTDIFLNSWGVLGNMVVVDK